jgi:hypothetical protein
VLELILPNVLFIQKQPIRLPFPWHVAEIMKCKGDGFNSTYPTGTFTGHGHKITVSYHHLTGLPLLHTAPSDHYHQYCIQSHACTSILQSLPQSESTSMFLLSNLMPAQRIKLILHEHCNQVNMQQLNHWIRKGHFPVDPSFANSPDPMCCACQYGKENKRLTVSIEDQSLHNTII